MNKKQKIFVGVAAVITLSGAYQVFPQNTIKKVAADYSPSSFTQTLGSQPLSFNSSYADGEGDKFFFFPKLLFADYQSPLIDNVSKHRATKSVLLSVEKTNGDEALWQGVNVEINVNKKDGNPETVYNGPISGLQNIELLKPENYSFADGLIETIRAEMWFSGKTNGNVDFRFVITPR